MRFVVENKGRPAKYDPSIVLAIQMLDRGGTSNRSIARQLGISHGLVDILKRELGLPRCQHNITFSRCAHCRAAVRRTVTEWKLSLETKIREAEDALRVAQDTLNGLLRLKFQIKEAEDKPSTGLLPGAFYLGFLSNVSMHRDEAGMSRSERYAPRCTGDRACRMPVAEGDLCRYHAHFFDYADSLEMGIIDLRKKSLDETGLSIVSRGGLSHGQLYFEHKGIRTRQRITD